MTDRACGQVRPAADRLAAELRDGERHRRPVPLLTARFPGFAWSDARAVARARDRLRAAEGDRQVGYKLGWTSAAMRQSLGVSQPNWGTLWASQLVAAGGVVDTGVLLHPKIEPELVYRAGADLRGPVGRARVADACAGWALGLEIVDPRFPDYRFDWLDNTADNSSAARVVVSAASTPGADPRDWTVRFGDGDTMLAGRGAAAMGSPVEAVRWLAEALAAEGEIVRAGDMVFTGGLTAPLDVVAGATYRVSAPAASLSVSVTTAPAPE